MTGHDIVFIGAGNLGLALAHVLSQKYARPSLVLTRDPQLADFLNKNQRHPSKLHAKTINIHALSEPSTALKGARFAFICTHSTDIGNVIALLQQYAAPDIYITLCSKGFHDGAFSHEAQHNTDPFLSTFIQHSMSQSRVTILSGPNFAEEILSGVSTITTIAANRIEDATMIGTIFSETNITTMSNLDIKGVQCVGACKNIIAIALGITQGMHQDSNDEMHNHHCAIMVHMLQELGDIIEKLGGNTNTLLSPAGIGDIILTCGSDKSRNKSFGIQIGLLIRQFAHEIDLRNLADMHNINNQERSRLASRINVYVSQLQLSAPVEGYRALGVLSSILQTHQMDVPYFNDLNSLLYQETMTNSFLYNYIGWH